MAVPDEGYHREISEELSGYIKELIDRLGLLGKEDLSVLIVGLGNRQVTPDALGPYVVDNLCGNSIVALNKSPSKYSLKTPPCISVRLLAMDNPNPLPSVLLEMSPRMNRSVSSSAEMFNGCSEMFFNEKITFSSSNQRSA